MKILHTDEDRPRYPQMRERLGEDPARFLATGMDPTPRISGIRDLGLANVYLQVARELDGCPQRVVDACERRRDHLVEEAQRGE